MVRLFDINMISQINAEYALFLGTNATDLSRARLLNRSIDQEKRR